MTEPIKPWIRRKITVYLANYNVRFLDDLSAKTGIPQSRIIDQALDNFFKNHVDTKIIEEMAKLTKRD
jgi:hypothetical protein